MSDERERLEMTLNSRYAITLFRGPLGPLGPPLPCVIRYFATPASHLWGQMQAFDDPEADRLQPGNNCFSD